ncbi:replication-associated protein [Dragonfly larvae associated circular virus-2]|uniref:Replication-associated protein n=1 Tax=Dragonfly larvae associated circular virus-2 TaxID=1454023 RepID=W5U7Q2_9VIRU|nr:replication-associated protein [Dragonfly larvae associated circular virus-2]AHH31462.1 replication-associated protein [Dragonfly larvae associated circular virus-2]
MARRQGIFWLLTIPRHEFVPYLPPGCVWIRGQLEEGGEDGYLHWQVMVAFTKKIGLSGVKVLFGPAAHAELSRSAAATQYVWKEETRVAGTQFNLGAKPFERNSKRDWDSIWLSAQEGNLEAIPADVRVVSYRTLRAIGSDYAVPRALERTCYVFWGSTGTGKSRTAWEQAGMDAYCKDPRSKFWDGYCSQENVVIDEFRGGIDISHILRWLDRYPVRVEIKGSSRPLQATKLWITSNLDPNLWYPDIDAETLLALRRRLTITHFA